MSANTPTKGKMNETEIIEIDESVDGGVRAFIYQKLAELEEILPTGTEIDVSLTAALTDDDVAPQEAVVSVFTEGGEVSARASGKDEYDAIGGAVEILKHEIIEELPLENSESIVDARENLVNAIIDKNYLH